MSKNKFAYRGFKGTVGETFASSKPFWHREPRPSEGAPNIVVVLVDDLGYSDFGCYGGEIDTPNTDALAADGVQFTNFQATPMCSPTRASLLTGVNHHLAGVADVLFDDPGFPGYLGGLRSDVATLPEVLGQHGYRTFMVGKWHLSKESQLNAAASRHTWPLQRGFDEYFGVVGAYTNLHQPSALVDGNSVLRTDVYPSDFYLTDALTDRAVSMIKDLRAHDSKRPFFLYYSHLAVHAPHHAKTSDIKKYAGQYSEGWEAIRNRRYEKQLELGVLPPGTQISRNLEPEHSVPEWSSFSIEEQRVLSRHMEVYAGMVDSVDQSIGALVNELKSMGEYENTIFVVMSDNGGTAEGEAEGSIHYMDYIASRYIQGPGALETEEALAEAHERIEEIGGPRTMPIYPKGWAQASNTPFRQYKLQSHKGGRQVPFVFSWPKNTKKVAGLRDQYSHVTDVMPTLLDLVGICAPETRNGEELIRFSGQSAAEIIRDAAAETRHREQYIERGGNRGYYRDGWEIISAAGEHPGLIGPDWELYHTSVDPTHIKNIAADHKPLIDELESAWTEAAWENQVFPMDDKVGLREALRNPAEQHLRDPVLLYPGCATLERYRSMQLINTRSFELEINFDHQMGATGALVAHGDQSGGYMVYIEDDLVCFVVLCRSRSYTAIGSQKLQPGLQSACFSIKAPGDLAWIVSANCNGIEMIESIKFPMLWGMTPFQGIDVGMDRRSPVSWEHYLRRPGFKYQGEIRNVKYRPGEWAPDSPYNKSVDELRSFAREISLACE